MRRRLLWLTLGSLWACHGGALTAEKSVCMMHDCSSQDARDASAAASARKDGAADKPDNEPDDRLDGSLDASGDEPDTGGTGSTSGSGGTSGAAGAGGSAGGGVGGELVTADDAGGGDARVDDGGHDSGEPPYDPDAGVTTDALAHYVAPRVVYAGQPATLRVFGTAITDADGAPVFVGNRARGTLTAVNDGEGRTTLPALEAGEHVLQIGRPASADRAGARLTVVSPIEYEDVDVPVPGQISSMIYDPGRRAFYAVFSGTLARVQYTGAAWQVDDIDVPLPITVTMTADGRELLVTNQGCTLIHLDPDTLALGDTETVPASCFFEPYGIIHALADGQSFYADNYLFRVFEYPSLQEVMDGPDLYSAITLMSQDQTRMFWAQPNSISGPHRIYHYDAGASTFVSFTTVAPDNYGNNLAVSRDGHRFTHDSDVYDRDLNFLGSLDAGDPAPWAVGLSGDGTVAVAFDFDTQTLRAFDVSGTRGPFPAVAEAVSVMRDTLGSVYRVIVDETGHHAFAFATHGLGGSGTMYEHHMMVRRVRDLP